MKKNRCIQTDCERFYRRDFIKAGVLGLFGLNLTELFRLKAAAKTPLANASSTDAPGNFNGYLRYLNLARWRAQSSGYVGHEAGST